MTSSAIQLRPVCRRLFPIDLYRRGVVVLLVGESIPIPLRHLLFLRLRSIGSTTARRRRRVIKTADVNSSIEKKQKTKLVRVGEKNGNEHDSHVKRNEEKRTYRGEIIGTPMFQVYRDDIYIEVSRGLGFWYFPHINARLPVVS